jgi:hypothetical protein
MLLDSIRVTGLGAFMMRTVRPCCTTQLSAAVFRMILQAQGSLSGQTLDFAQGKPRLPQVLVQERSRARPSHPSGDPMDRVTVQQKKTRGLFGFS